MQPSNREAITASKPQQVFKVLMSFILALKLYSVSSAFVYILYKL